MAECGLAKASDAEPWSWAGDRDSILVSKDEDFFHLANRRSDRGRLVWIRLGNFRKPTLLGAIERTLPTILAAFDSGQRIVELT